MEKLQTPNMASDGNSLGKGHVLGGYLLLIAIEAAAGTSEPVML